MFWGVTLEKGKRYTQTVDASFHLSMAALEPYSIPEGSEKKCVSLMLEHGKAEYLICSLQDKKIFQVNLDLIFVEGEEITFYLNGEGTVHLSGYVLEDSDSEPMDRDYDLDECSDEEAEEEEEIDTTMGETTLDELCAAGYLDEEEDEEWSPKKKDALKKPQTSLPAIKAASPAKKGQSPNNKKDSKSNSSVVKVDSPSKKSKTYLNSIQDSDDEDDDDDESGEDEESDMESGDDEESDIEDSDEEFDSDEDEESDENTDAKKRKQTPSKTPQSSKKPKLDSENKEISSKDIATRGLVNGVAKLNSSSKKSPKTPVANEAATPNVDLSGLSKSQRKKMKQRMRKLSQSSLEGETPKPESPKLKTPKPKQTPKAQQTPKGQQTPKPSGDKSAKKSLPGGTQVIDVTQGHGPVAKPGKFVHVYYTGKLANGKEFDSTTSGKPFAFRLGKGEVIKGWDSGVEGMQVGGKRTIIVPPNQGYGPKRQGPIPPNSTLHFDVELKAVN